MLYTAKLLNVVFKIYKKSPCTLNLNLPPELTIGIGDEANVVTLVHVHNGIEENGADNNSNAPPHAGHRLNHHRLLYAHM